MKDKNNKLAKVDASMATLGNLVVSTSHDQVIVPLGRCSEHMNQTCVEAPKQKALILVSLCVTVCMCVFDRSNRRGRCSRNI